MWCGKRRGQRRRWARIYGRRARGKEKSKGEQKEEGESKEGKGHHAAVFDEEVAVFDVGQARLRGGSDVRTQEARGKSDVNAMLCSVMGRECRVGW